MSKRFICLLKTVACLGLVLFLWSCTQTSIEGWEDSDTPRHAPAALPLAYEGITELRRGDIIVRANSNIFPGTTFVEGGWNYGHAAIITHAASGHHPDSILSKARMFESHARNLPRMHQLREVKALDLNKNPLLFTDSFSAKYTGTRYRLRLNIPESQLEEIITFVESQKGSYSSWNASKSFPDTPAVLHMLQQGQRDHWADNTHWYCSLLVWQAVLYVTGIDLDPNGGYYVYPNDLIASPWFNNTGIHKGRTRF